MKSIQDSTYIFTLTVAVINNNASTRTLNMLCWSAANTYGTNIYPTGISLTTASNTFIYLKITQGSSTNVNVKSSLDSSGTSPSCLLNGNNLPLQFSFSSTGSADLRLFFYILKVNVASSNTNSVYGVLSCSSDTDCVEGYSCIGSICKRKILIIIKNALQGVSVVRLILVLVALLNLLVLHVKETP